MDRRVLSWQQRHGFALSFALALAVALFAFPIAAHAADEAGNVFSSSSSNPSSIEGDLYWIGRALDLDSTTVGRDVLAAGETLDIDNTQVGGSIRTAGKTINISKTSVDGNLTLAGQYVTVDKSSSAAGAYIAAQDINLSSSVKTAALYGETVVLDGTVTGNVSIYAEKLIITKNASLLGNVKATLSEKPTIDDNAHIERPINVTFDKRPRQHYGLSLLRHQHCGYCTDHRMDSSSRSEFKCGHRAQAAVQDHRPGHARAHRHRAHVIYDYCRRLWNPRNRHPLVYHNSMCNLMHLDLHPLRLGKSCSSSAEFPAASSCNGCWRFCRRRCKPSPVYRLRHRNRLLYLFGRLCHPLHR